MDWKAEVFKRLDALAEKLGTTGTYLWSVLIKQAKLEGYVDLIMGTLLVLLFISGITNGLRLMKKIGDDDPSYYQATIMVLSFVAAFIGLAFGPVCLYDGVLAYMNPDFVALQKVLSTLR